MLDIISIAYNSEKWLNGYFNGLLGQMDFDLCKVNLIIIDNNSTDNSLSLLNDYRDKYSKNFYHINIIGSKKNLGFAKGNNEAAKYSKFDYLLFINIDTCLQPDNLKILETEILNNDEKVGAWELRQMPYEHPKYYHPVTLETSWASGAAILIRKDIFIKIDGFDPHFFMYCEDVDISWRIRMEDKVIKYLPNCCFYHYSYPVINEIKEIAYIYGILNNLFLRLKFGDKKDVNEWMTNFRNILKNRGPFEHSRKMLIKALLKNLLRLPAFIRWKRKNKKNLILHSPKKFLGFDYEITRKGEFYYTILPKFKPLVSVLVRTCNRPEVLRRTLLSLRNQTYKNFEIVMIEDGLNESENLVKNEFTDLTIKYHATITKGGRCNAGNIALEKSSGKLLCFLDDDDYFYPDYIETMVAQFERNPDLHIANSLAFKYEIETVSTVPYQYNIKLVKLHHSPVFNFLQLVSENYYTIQSVMFKRKVYEELGGFNLDIDYAEDWLLWLKYTSKYPMYSILKVCSVYKVPWETEIKISRQNNFVKYRNIANAYESKLKLEIDLFSLAELQKTNL